MFNIYGSIFELSCLRWVRSFGVAATYRGSVKSPRTFLTVSPGAHRRPVRCSGAPCSPGGRVLWPSGIEGIHGTLPGGPWNSLSDGPSFPGIGRSRDSLNKTCGISTKGILPGLPFGMSHSGDRGTHRIYDFSPCADTDPANPVQLQAKTDRPSGTRTFPIGRNPTNRRNWPYPDAGPGTSLTSPKDRRSGMVGPVPKSGVYCGIEQKSFLLV